MPATDLIVPVQIHALVVNNEVRTNHPFYRPKPDFGRMLGEDYFGSKVKRGDPEPDAFNGSTDQTESAGFEGVRVQWELPDALTGGFVDPATDETHYPLVPNRWLVVRFADIPGRTTTPRGWIVHSDYLNSDDDSGRYDDKTENSFVVARSNGALSEDYLGTTWDLARQGTWKEPATRELFLTAVGAGLPLFAAFEPYHEGVFAFHDNLQDLKSAAEGDSYPPNATLSYLVTGWYSNTDKDILRVARDIPGLLPPDGGSISEIVRALGWTLAPRPVATCTIPGNGDSAPPHSGPVDLIFDGREDTWFETASAVTASDNITIDLGVPHRLSEVTATFGEYPEGARIAPGKKLQASLDGKAWTDLGTAIPTQDAFTWNTNIPIPARYLRIQWTGASTTTTVVRNVTYNAIPDATGIDRSIYSGTALGLDWNRSGPAPDDDRPGGRPLSFALGHSTGEATQALMSWQTGSPTTARLFSALYHGTLATFAGPEGEQDLAETMHRSWFSGSDGGTVWQIRPRADADTDTPARRGRAGETDPPWLAELNADQNAYDSTRAELGDLQWRVWALYWLRYVNQNFRPSNGGPPADFDARADLQLNPANSGSLAAAAQQARGRLDALAAKLPDIPPDAEDPQAAIDAFAARKGLPDYLQLSRTPADSFYQPADPVLVVEGSAGGIARLGREPDDPLLCRTTDTMPTQISIGGSWFAPSDDPPRPDITGLPALVKALIGEMALLDQAARTTAGDSTALAAITADPAGNVRGLLGEYTAPWRQPWLPITIMWKLEHFYTPYRTGSEYNWTFQAPEDDPSASVHYRWNGTGAPASDTDSPEGVLSRLFRSRAYLTPTTAFVMRTQLAAYLQTHTTDVTALTELREAFKSVDILSQRLDGYNDWLLTLDGGAQVPTEAPIAPISGDQPSVPSGTSLTEQHFDVVRAGQFCFAQLRIVDRFGRIVDIITSADATLRFPVRAASVIPNMPLRPGLDNPDRYIQLPPRIMQDIRLTFTPRPSPQAAVGNPVIGWLLVNYLDRTLALHGPAGEALGELRVTITGTGQPTTSFSALPYSPYSGLDDPAFASGHPDLAGFLEALIDRGPDAFDALVATIDRKLTSVENQAPFDDHLPAHLIGKPCALIRTDLNLQLKGPARKESSWTILDAPAPEFPSYTWPIRLGTPYSLDDGLIGYFASPTDGSIDYTVLSAVSPAGQNAYIKQIGNGADLALPARPPDAPVTRSLTLLADPHLATHATTDILPVLALRLDADEVHDALARIHASFRLNPLLAPERTGAGFTASSSMPGYGSNYPAPSGPIECMLDGSDDTLYQTGRAPEVGDWVQVDLSQLRRVSSIFLQFGDKAGTRIAPAKTLQASEDGEQWTNLATASSTTRELRYTPGEGQLPQLSARYLRVLMTGSSQYTTVIRNFTVTTIEPIVLPLPSSRYGTWTWAEAQTVTDGIRTWEEHELIPADQLTHPDDPVPVARAGYLQLMPASPDMPPPADRLSRRNQRP